MNAPSPNPADAPEPAPLHPAPGTPLVLLDYTGTLIEWVRALARDPRLRCVLTDGIDPARCAGDAPPPAGTVVLGIKPGELTALARGAVLEVHARES